MRDLTPDETRLRNERREQFAAFKEEIEVVLVDLAEGLQLEDSQALLKEPETHLAAIDTLVASGLIDDQLRRKLLARVGCLVGEMLCKRLGGFWIIDETPDSPHFLHFTVGRFNKLSSPALMADPFAVAAAYLDQLEVKDLGGLVEAVVGELYAVQPEALA